MNGSEDRPKPQYGEYATPEEVAAARGPLPVEPSDPSPSPSVPIARAAPVAAAAPRSANNLITVLLLVFGIWNTVSSIPSYLDFGPALSEGVQLAGYGEVTFGPVARTAGIVLLVISLLLLIAAVGVSFQFMRRRRRSIWVPVVAGALDVIATIVVMTVVVANTPALTDVLQTH